MALNRDAVRRLAAGGGSAHKIVVHLPDLDEDVWVRKLTRSERQEVTLWAGAQLGMLDDDLESLGQELNAETSARIATLVSVGALRYALCDGNGAPLLESFDEAEGVFNGLTETDFGKVNTAFGELRDVATVGDVEEGKGSCGTTPPSPPSSPSDSSSADGSPASSDTSPTPN